MTGAWGRNENITCVKPNLNKMDGYRLMRRKLCQKTESFKGIGSFFHAGLALRVKRLACKNFKNSTLWLKKL